MCGLLLAGCGDDKSSSAKKRDTEAAKVLAGAPAKTRAAKSARIRLVTASSGRRIFHATGVTRLDSDRARMQTTFDTKIGALEAGTVTDNVIAGDYVYVRLRDGGPWVRTPRTGGSTQYATGIAESLKYLSAVTGSVRRLDDDTVRGEQVRVYSTTVDLERVAEQLPADEQDAYRANRERVGLPERLPLEVAIDDAGRLVRMDYDITSRGVDLNVLLELHDFGATGNLAVPTRFREP